MPALDQRPPTPNVVLSPTTPVPGVTLWLTGLPSAGKTTIATALAPRLRARGRRVELLDGDAVRTHLSRGLGFSRADRDENILRIGYVAALLARNGVTVVTAVVSPYAEARAAVRAMHEDSGTPFVEVYVATPVAVCSRRDVKGLYAQQRSGALIGLTGVDDPYQPPLRPDVALPADRQTVAESVSTLLAALSARGLA